jgi:hypothetical protein
MACRINSITRRALGAGHRDRRVPVRRFGPITLTASAAVLALIPLAREVFWAPMALAMMGGLIAATILTLTFLPALYALVFKVGAPTPATALGEVPANRNIELAAA